MENNEVLQDWFHRSGVQVPLNTCIGPLPNTGASIVRWKSDTPDARLLTWCRNSSTADRAINTKINARCEIKSLCQQTLGSQITFLKLRNSPYSHLFCHL